MEVFLSPDLQAKLTRLAATQGLNTEAPVIEAVERMVDSGDRFLSEVQAGLSQIREGQTLSHEDVGIRLGAYLARQQQPA